MLKIAIVGMGFMGRTHLRCWSELDNAKVVAICDKNIETIKNSSAAVGNIDTGGDKLSLDGFKLYDDFDKMLDDGGFDAISLTLPTFLHCELTIKALQAGYDVLCEKPMALNSEQCQQMIEAAEKTGRKLMVGHCIRFWPEYAVAKEIIDSGKYGKVLQGRFDRISPRPGWSADNWMGSLEKSGGMALDLHIHDSDFVQYVFGMPVAVCAVDDDPAASAYIKTEYFYEDKKMIAVGAWYDDAATQFVMSFDIQLEQAKIVYNCNKSPAFEVIGNDGQRFSPSVPAGDGYSRQIAYFADMLQGQARAEIITARQSGDSVRLIEAEIESLKSKQKESLIS